MAKATVPLSNAPKIPGAIGKKFKEAAKKAAAEIVKTLQANAIAETKAQGAVATGEYAKSWVVRRRGLFQFILENKAGHSGFVESGRKPSAKRPPPGKILLWVKRKLHISSNKQAVRVAFLVGRAISRNGVRGRAILAAAIRRSEGRIAVILRKHFGSAAK